MAELPPPSLRWRLLLGLLLPLLALTVVNAWWVYARAARSANDAFDRSLYLAARTLAEDLQWREGQVQLQMRPGTGYLFEHHTGSRLFYQVRDAQGQVLLGADDLPQAGAQVQQVHFFALVDFADVQYRKTPMRLARLTHVLPQVAGASTVLQVHVAETRETRDALIQTILRETLLSQLVLLGATVLLVLCAVRLAVRPLHRLRALLEAKSDHDFQPLPQRHWPRELAPLVLAINSYLHRLSRLMEIRKRFLDNAAHQLRTPLTALKTQLDLLQRQTSGPPTALVQAAVRTTDDAVRLTAQLLALSRAEHGAELDQRVELDLVTLARQVTEEHLWRAHARGDDLGFEACPEPVQVLGNAVLLREALTNLIDNAMQHADPGGRITVRVMARCLEVEDDGPGIAPEHQPHVFERFYQAIGLSRRGSGLGLAIVREIAQQHGAHVQLDSPVQAGRGTRIRLCWPQV